MNNHSFPPAFDQHSANLADHASLCLTVTDIHVVPPASRAFIEQVFWKKKAYRAASQSWNWELGFHNVW